MSEHRHIAINLTLADRKSSALGLAQPCGIFDQRVQHRLQIEGRAADDLEYVRRGSLLLPRRFQLARESSYLLLQVGNGCRCNHASLGSIRATTLDGLLASTTLAHFAPLGWVPTRLNLMQILGFAPWQEVGSGSKCEELSVSRFSPLC